MIFTTSHDLGTPEPPYLCSICHRPIHPSEGALCVVCRHMRYEQRQHVNAMRRLVRQYPKLDAMYLITHSGVQSDWDNEDWRLIVPDHATMQTTAACRAPSPGWQCELAVILRDQGVSWVPGDDDDSKWDALALVDADAAVARLMQELRDIGAFGNDAVA